MSQDEANVMVLIFLFGVIWSVVRSAIKDHLSSHNNSGGAPVSPVLHQNQSLAPSRLNVDLRRPAGEGGNAGEIGRDIDLIRRIDPTFDPQKFLHSGCLVYEAVVMAFANGDRDLLRDLTSDDVYDEFTRIIAEREQRGERVELTLICFKAAAIEKISLFNKRAQITFGFTAQLVTATRDANGTVVDGDPATVSEVRDLWTFACDLGSETPVWKLVATDSP